MTDTSATSPPPPPAARPAPAGRSEGRQTRSDFQAALDDAQRRGGPADDPRSDDDDAGEGSTSGRKRKGDGGLMSLLGLKEPPRGTAHGAAGALARAPRDRKDGGLEGVGAQAGGSTTGAAPSGEVAAAGSTVDAAAFAEMVEQAAARGLQGPADAPITVALNDARSPVQAFQLARLPDGSLSLSLQAEAGAVPEVSRSLDALRRRLEARGLSLGEIRLADGGEALGPSAAEGADPG